MEPRPLDIIKMAGAPADPLRFPPPRYNRSKRVANVTVYNPKINDFFDATDVLVPCYNTNTTRGEETFVGVKAYWKIPEKQRINTIMGYIEVCYVLKCHGSDINYRNFYDGVQTDDQMSNGDGIFFELTMEKVAVKSFSWERTIQLRGHFAESPLNEIAAMQILGNECPHVLGCIDVLFDGIMLYAVLPYCNSGDLHQRMESWRKNNPQHQGGLPEVETRFWFLQLIEGLRYLQKKGICHRDLSPENIMIDNQRGLIIDMGMCLLVPYSSETGDITDSSRGIIRRMIKPQTQCGKLRYISPEIFLNQEPFDGFAVDIWTAGTVLFFLLTGAAYKQPFDPFFIAAVTDLERLLAFMRVNISSRAINLLKGLLKVDPGDRLTLEEIIGHPWVQYGPNF
jgi:serine/threonine protein kinase